MEHTLEIDSDLHLKPVALAHAPELFDLVDRNRAHLRQWLPWLDFNQTVADSTNFIERSIKLADEGAGLVTLIMHKNRMCGVIGYNRIDSLNSACDIGYWLAETEQKLGIMSRSTQALIEYAFTDLKMNRIGIAAAVQNSKSRAIPERFGFTAEGIIREAEWLYDHFVDLVQYSLLRSEWENRDDP